MPLPLQTSLSLVLLALGFYLLWRIPHPGEGRPVQGGSTPRPSLSVIIPARNQERSIGRLLASLRPQCLTGDEILVVDDGSTDRTRYVAGEFDATVIEGEPPPEGWASRSWACWQGAQRAGGELLLFLDADTWLEPAALNRLVISYGQGPGLLSVEPYHLTEKPYEQLSAIFNIIRMAGVNAFTSQGHRIMPNGAFGACLLTRRRDYARVGGHAHEAVRGHLLEGTLLARAHLTNGLPVRCYGGRGAVIWRMFPVGPGQLVEGWEEHLGTGALTMRWPHLLMTVGWITGCFNALAGLALALSSGDSLNLVAHALVYALCAGQIAWMLGRMGRYRSWTPWLYPIPLFFLLLVMLRWLVVTRLLGRMGRER